VFTGLIRQLGTLERRDARGLTIACPALRAGLNDGDSVAVNGACLTVAELTERGFRADLLEDTRGATTLGKLPIGTRLNLEPALKASDSLGGHFVQGHVDGTVRLLDRSQPGGADWRLAFELPEWLRPYVLSKGSIALDGVSLTVQGLDAQVLPPSFAVAIIPTTWAETALSDIAVGAEVNVEADLLVRTVRGALEELLGEGGLSADKLREWGYGQ